jgi:Polyketide cyclase / dehydrase and lipid transport
MTERSILIHAPIDAIYRLVADPIRMADWSPECVRCRWVGESSQADVGARFRGTSRNGWHRWTRTSPIADMRDGELSPRRSPTSGNQSPDGSTSPDPPATPSN